MIKHHITTVVGLSVDNTNSVDIVTYIVVLERIKRLLKSKF